MTTRRDSKRVWISAELEPMDGSEHRQIARDSLFLLADLRVDGLSGEYRIKVRNLSDGGMMGEGNVRVHRGSRIDVNLRNIGWVEGTVAWVQDSRFGVAFHEPIDPRLARAKPAAADDSAPSYLRGSAQQASTGQVRKV
jgi:hypothetical protein